MYIVLMCPYSQEHENTTKRPEIWALVSSLGEAMQVCKDRIGEFGDHLVLKWELQSDYVHRTIVYGGIGFLMIVKDEE